MRIEDRLSPIQQQLKRFAGLCVAVFYGRFEVEGLENIPEHGPVLLCANHANAIVDGVIMMAAYPGLLRPIARSGLFQVPVLSWILHAQGAVERIGGEVSSAVQRQQVILVQEHELLQPLASLNLPENVLEHRPKGLGVERVENLAHLRVAGDMDNLVDRGEIAALAPLVERK